MTERESEQRKRLAKALKKLSYDELYKDFQQAFEEWERDGE